MDTKKIVRAVEGGFAGFLLIVCAYGAFFLAFVASFDPVGLGSSISSLTWFLLLVVIPPLVTLASALPAISLGASKKFSLIAGFVAFIFAVIIYTIPVHVLGSIFNHSWPLTLVTPICVVTVATNFQTLKGRKRRIGIILAIWVLLSILGIVVADFSRIAGFFMVLLAWVVLPGTAAMLQGSVEKQR